MTFISFLRMQPRAGYATLLGSRMHYRRQQLTHVGLVQAADGSTDLRANYQQYKALKELVLLLPRGWGIRLG